MTTGAKDLKGLTAKELASQLLRPFPDYDLRAIRAENDRRNRERFERQNAEYRAKTAGDAVETGRESGDRREADERREIEREEAEDRDIDALFAELESPRSEGRPASVTGADADIEANYPGGLAAFRRDEAGDVNRTPIHKGDA